jgi:hypothetical protein
MTLKPKNAVKDFIIIIVKITSKRPLNGEKLIKNNTIKLNESGMQYEEGLNRNSETKNDNAAQDVTKLTKN